MKSRITMNFSEIFGTEGVYSHLKCTRIKTKYGIFLLASQKHTDRILDVLNMKDCNLTLVLIENLHHGNVLNEIKENIN